MNLYAYAFIADSEPGSIPAAMNARFNTLEHACNGEYERECWRITLASTGCLDARREPPR